MIARANIIRRLRFRERPANPRAARTHVETAVADVASRVGSEAILCVRRITTALPRLSSALDAEATQAVRPAFGAVPASANAVFFADEPELLACLARDWCHAPAVATWWRHTLFPGRDLSDIVRRSWLDHPRFAPAALARLEEMELAVRFLAQLSVADLDLLWRGLVQTFDLAELQAAWNVDSTTLDDGTTSGEPAPFRNRAPWSRWVREEVSRSARENRVRIAALLLIRAPAVVRSRIFADAVRAWESHGGATRPVDERTPGCSTGALASTTHDGQVGEQERRLFPPPAITAEPHVAASQSSPARLDEAAASHAIVPHLDRTTSECGGLFYLVNVALALGLYGDFTQPAHPRLALPLWDFLALIGGRMLGRLFTDDPLSALLAHLSGRALHEPPGAWFEPDGGEGRAQWLETLVARIEMRLAGALGTLERDRLAILVLRHRAEIESSDTRVDVRFSLASHPLALRIAGLDRDPGWVPAAGRSIAFHYD